MEENCRIVLLFHKADPNFKAEPAFLENHARLRKLFIPEIQKRKFRYVTRITSVYSPINELEENLSQVVDLDVISEILMKVKANQSASEKKSLKERVKQLFRRTTKQQEIGVSLEPDAITDAEFEVENGFQILDSEAFKALLHARYFDDAAESIEYFVEAWNNFKERKKGNN